MNLLDKNGCKFRAEIDCIPCEGIIYVRGNSVYLLQNEKDGSKPRPFPSELGYDCSWHVSSGSPEDLEFNNVEDFEIIEELPIIASSSNCGKKKLLLLFL